MDKSIIMPLEATIEEVERQPEVVANAIRENRPINREIAREIIDKEIRNFSVIGSGDSFFVGMSVKQSFSQFAGISLIVNQAYDYAKFGDIASEKDSALMVISSSGRVSTTRDALDRALRESMYVIGVTDVKSQDNPFFNRPRKVLVPGGIKNGWPTQTTTATIGVLLDLAIRIGEQNGNLSVEEATRLTNQLDAIPSMMDSVLVKCKATMNLLGERFSTTNGIYFIGSGPGYGVANIGAAVMAEGPQKIGIPVYVEEFHHSLRLNTIKPGTPVFLIAPKDPAYHRYLDTVNAVTDWGGYLIAIIEENDTYISSKANAAFCIPTVPYQMSPLLTLMPIHLFSIEITKALINQGYQRPWQL